MVDLSTMRAAALQHLFFLIQTFLLTLGFSDSIIIKFRTI